jgi:chemotaxis protein MotA
MDRSTLIGLLLGWGAFVGAVIWEGGGAGALGAFWNPPAFLLVIGGTVGATVLSFPLDRIRALPATLRKAFVAGDGPDFGSVIRTLAGLAERARREGLLALEPDVRRQSDPFLKKGLAWRSTAPTPSCCARSWKPRSFTCSAGTTRAPTSSCRWAASRPTLGVIGTVAGLVFMLLEMSDQESMGRRISGAFIATLYGVSFANLLLLPIGNKLKRRSEAEVLRWR